MQSLAQTFPPLYECSVCGASVKVTPQGLGKEPTIERPCGHADAVVYANRKVTLLGRGKLENMNLAQRWTIKVTLKMRAFLSAMTGRSI